ncbi:DUF3139 domain-containing protein [Finegoldia magna]|uniref:DUF3139 domain-containing protein n=1 Tax=Finegoldia magna TaxID=1260 RepID=UPI000B91C3E1|nr:DUF3139 domain-containing protein [Finegoldia magna]MDU2131274.1 DUF3139 domain-containing protein [Finegoldia magna]MDU2219663.1 DUF3139 domain-containing protein [Finegoldia magna]MDU6552257.1 DUF3139 domain-containing protein [Finegoldia magna]OXZ33053.1 hypothetical protein B9N53_08885 [Finegoldia magna]
MKRLFKILLTIVVVYLIVGWTYNHPVQYFCGKHKLYSFMEKQGTSKDNILKISSGYNYKNGDYDFYVIFKDDPLVEYRYSYHLTYFSLSNLPHLFEDTDKINVSIYEYATGSPIGNTYFKKAKYMKYTDGWY